LAAEVAVSHDVTIGAGARVGGRSGVVNDIPAGETWLGTPAVPAVQAARNYFALKTIAEDMRGLKRMQRSLEREAAARE
ncbi:MAG: hypothetical protein WD749_06830, partial [Phycisphaerales bacterium]